MPKRKRKILPIADYESVTRSRRGATTFRSGASARLQRKLAQDKNEYMSMDETIEEMLKGLDKDVANVIRDYFDGWSAQDIYDFLSENWSELKGTNDISYVVMLIREYMEEDGIENEEFL
jgi:hypothetical protein